MSTKRIRASIAAGIVAILGAASSACAPAQTTTYPSPTVTAPITTPIPATGSPQPSTPGTGQPSSPLPSPSSAPSLSILAPTAGSVVIDPNVSIQVQVAGFKLADKIGQTNVPGEGHLAYFIDSTAPTAPGQPATTAPGTYAQTAATLYQWPNVPDGVHVFSVELVNNDGTPLSPPVTAQVSASVFTG